MNKSPRSLILFFLLILGFSSANSAENKLGFHQCLEQINKNTFTCQTEENDSVRCFDEEMRSIFFEKSNSVPYDLEVIKVGNFRWEEQTSYKNFNHFTLTKNNIKLRELKISLYVNNQYRVGEYARFNWGYK